MAYKYHEEFKPQLVQPSKKLGETIQLLGEATVERNAYNVAIYVATIAQQIADLALLAYELGYSAGQLDEAEKE